jgi:alpha-beta hydrolase superfamily lysophospholipase
VIFAHGCGGSRRSPGNLLISKILHRHRIGTFLFDLLTERESRQNDEAENITVLTRRVLDVTSWLQNHTKIHNLPLAYFGSGSGGSAALRAALIKGGRIQAVVTRSAHLELVGPDILKLKTPVLFVAGEREVEIVSFHRALFPRLQMVRELKILPGVSSQYAEPGALEELGSAAAGWLTQHFHTFPQFEAA